MNAVDRYFREPIVRPGTGRYAPRMLKPIPALGALAVVGTIGMWLLFAALARLVGQEVSWVSPYNGSVERAALFDLVRSTATLFALFGGLFAVLYAYRKQRVEEAAGHRADAEALSKRYQDAALQLGNDKAAVRLAGVYALARLADEWEEQRQTCVSVLCAYLRIAVPTKDYDVGEGHSVTLPDHGELEVRRAIVGLIGLRVQPFETGGLWSSCDFDLRYAQLPDFALKDARVTGTVTLVGAELSGSCSFVNLYLAKGMDCRGARIAGVTRFRNVTMRSDAIAIVFEGVSIEEGCKLTLAMAAHKVRKQPQVTLGDNECRGRLSIEISASDYEPGPFQITGLHLHPGSSFRLSQPIGGAAGNLPVVRAIHWHTDEGASVVVPKELAKAGRFEGQGWRGDQLPKMSRFYTDSLYVMGNP